MIPYKLPFKSFIFVRQRGHTTSERMLGLRFIEDLIREGVSARVVDIQDVRAERLRNCIVLFVKSWSYSLVEELRSNGNAVVGHLSDLIAVDRLHCISRSAPLNGIIFPNQITLLRYSAFFSNCTYFFVLPHFLDFRYGKQEARVFRLGFLGANSPLNWELYVNEFSEIEMIDPAEDIFERAKAFSCHYSVRIPGSLTAMYKPQSKLFTAAACGANIIASRDPGFLEVLPEYPFYTDCDRESVLDTIEKARRSYGRSEWREGLCLLEGLQKEYSVERYNQWMIEFAERMYEGM